MNTNTTGRTALIEDYERYRDTVRRMLPHWFPVGSRVLVPASYGGTIGTVSGYHSAEADAVWVRLDVPAGNEGRTALVLAKHLKEAE